MFELNTRYTFTTPDGTISEAGIHEIVLYVLAQRVQDEMWKSVNPDTSISLLPILPEDWNWTWIVTGRGEYVGTMPKRISKFYYKEFGLKCPAQFLSEIGNIARAHSGESIQYEFDFVNRFDWQSGAFGDGGSCFWGSNSHARTMLENGGGMAIRFFDEYNRGFARAWIVAIEDSMYVVFNGYGFEGGATLAITRIFSMFVNLSYKKIELTNHTSDTLYVNGNSGYIVGTPEQIAGIDYYDLDIENEYADRCDRCGMELQDHEVYMGVDDYPYCQDCFYHLFENCTICGETYWQEQVTYVDGDTVCEDCLNEHYIRCAGCDDYVIHHHIQHIKDEPFCRACYQERTQK